MIWTPSKPAIILPRREWIFPAAGRRKRLPATRTFLQKETTNGTTQSTYTFTNANIGTAASDRYVVAVIGASLTSVSGRTLNSVTIGGNAATIHANAAHSVAASSCHIVGIAGLLVTSGTTATIAATFSNTMARCFCFVYRLDGLASTTPTATATEGENDGGGDTTIADTINIPWDGILVAGVIMGTTTGSLSFSGVTEDSEENSSNILAGVASNQSMSAETNRAYSATTTANQPAKAMAAAAWR